MIYIFCIVTTSVPAVLSAMRWLLICRFCLMLIKSWDAEVKNLSNMDLLTIYGYFSPFDCSDTSKTVFYRSVISKQFHRKHLGRNCVIWSLKEAALNPNKFSFNIGNFKINSVVVHLETPMVTVGVDSDKVHLLEYCTEVHYIEL